MHEGTFKTKMEGLQHTLLFPDGKVCVYRVWLWDVLRLWVFNDETASAGLFTRDTQVMNYEHLCMLPEESQLFFIHDGAL